MAEMDARERLHFRIVHRKKDGIEADIDEAVAASGDAVEVLNNVLLPAMKEVGDKFGAGELILPFVLQSAEAMKKAVYPTRELPGEGRRLHQGQRRPRHRLRRCPRHRQEPRQHHPQQQRLHRPRPRQAGPDQHHHRQGGRGRRHRDRPLRPARLDQQADAALRQGAAPRRAQLPGHDRRRRDQPALCPPLALRRRRHRLRGGRLLREGCVRGALADGPHHRSRPARHARRRDDGGRPPHPQQAVARVVHRPRRRGRHPALGDAPRRSAGRAVLRRAGRWTTSRSPMSGRTST